MGSIRARSSRFISVGPLILGLLVKGPEDWPLSFHVMTAAALGSTMLALILRRLLQSHPR